MYKRDFLEKPYDVMNDIILYLYNTQNIVTKAELVRVFKLSFNTLNEYLRLIIAFIQKEDFGAQLKLTIESDQVSLEKSATFPIEHCTQIFLQNSMKYKILQHLFERGEIPSEMFQAEHNISSATYYRRITELNDLLKEFHLKIKRRRLVGEEKQIRYFFFCFYWFLSEDKETFANETSNQYVSFINQLSHDLAIDFQTSEILQIKLWMKISAKRLNRNQEFVFNPAYDSYERPLFNEINRILVNYSVKSEPQYSIYEAYMFYDFFCGMRNFSPRTSFSYRLAKAHKADHSYINFMSQMVLNYLQVHNYLSPTISEQRLAYIEHLLYQFHSQIYYFDGVIINFDSWSLNELAQKLRASYTAQDIRKLINFCQTTFSDYHERQAFSNQLAELNYTTIFNQLAEFNQELITVAVHQSLNPYLEDLVIQTIQQELGKNYPVQVLPFQDGKEYDILVSNVATEQLIKANPHQQVYTYGDFCSPYDLSEIKKILQQMLEDRTKSHTID
ncbi:hypothetical protein M2139_001886 [Enterococcus sp. PF1-24]|uniref:helix-turn-helix domain-containing protein n=1 Tax=unclassified Enterococcus TaxID=2608891 RepID=UPI00247507C6|nr:MULTISPECIES: helix-turn-helix domain-containing protein [unclassified Enterococcus]MDH6364885.1 hypothetical protein [Enterococcus sp. PFB1-1]MDH6401986.1 hypothetical protein [Enterococcus sp. PF1-24]